MQIRICSNAFVCACVRVRVSTFFYFGGGKTVVADYYAHTSTGTRVYTAIEWNRLAGTHTHTHARSMDLCENLKKSRKAKIKMIHTSILSYSSRMKKSAQRYTGKRYGCGRILCLIICAFVLGDRASWTRELYMRIISAMDVWLWICIIIYSQNVRACCTHTHSHVRCTYAFACWFLFIYIFLRLGFISYMGMRRWRWWRIGMGARASRLKEAHREWNNMTIECIYIAAEAGKRPQ